MSNRLDCFSPFVATKRVPSPSEHATRRSVIGRLSKLAAAFIGAGTLGAAATKEAAAICTGRCVKCRTNGEAVCRRGRLYVCQDYCCTTGSAGCGRQCNNTGRQCGY